MRTTGFFTTGTKTAKRSRIIMEFELKTIKNKTVQPDTVRYQVRCVWQEKRLYILCPFTPIKRKLWHKRRRILIPVGDFCSKRGNIFLAAGTKLLPQCASLACYVAQLLLHWKQYWCFLTLSIFLIQRPARPSLNFFHKYVGYILTLVKVGKGTAIAV